MEWWNLPNFAALSTADVGGAHLAAMHYTAMTQGRVYYTNTLQGVARTNLEELAAQVETLGFRKILSNPKWRGDKEEKYVFVTADSNLSIWSGDGELEANLHTLDRATYDALQVILEAAIGPKTSGGRVYVLAQTKEGPKLMNIGTASVPLERGNYNPEVLEDFDHIVDDLNTNTPTGRLAIFDGPAGSGKTHCIRGLLAAVPDALFVMVPVTLVPELASPNMISALIETRRNKGDRPTVFLIEDADDCLGSRDSTNVNAVSALLNLGDGIIGAMMDIRLVCTTNLKDAELDSAVVRPGRLSRKVTVGKLLPEIATAAYERLTGEKQRIRESLTIAEVYSMAKDKGWKPAKKARAVGFAATTSMPLSEVAYLKEQGLTSEEIEDVVVMDEADTHGY